jgi:chloramphenicol-sensitive protein RarD
VLLCAQGKFVAALKSLFSLQYFYRLFASALCLSINWLSYVIAVTNGEFVAASLAYYLCPLLTIFGATVLFRETLTRGQICAILLMLGGVLLPVLVTGNVAWMAIIIASSWSCYTLVRRHSKLGTVEGLFLETLLLSFVLAATLPLMKESSILFPTEALSSDYLLLLLSGLVTAAPIVALVSGMKYVPVKTVGALQYIAPTLMLLCSVTWAGKWATRTEAVGMIFIWCGVAVFFLGDSLLRRYYRWSVVKTRHLINKEAPGRL